MFANYDLTLVLASYVVAVFAAYTALYFGARLMQSEGGARGVWLFFGAVAMGTGVWTMHFVGMRASVEMAEMSYGAGLTTVSWLAAIAASAIALNLIGRDKLSAGMLMAASVAMGAGIVVMHYLGMFAMNMSMAPSFDAVWLAVSVVIALLASGAALAICRQVGREQGAKAIWLQLASALVMAAAICGMHYTGMLAMMYPDAATPAVTNTLSGDFLGLPLAILCSVLLGFAIAVAAIDMHGRRKEKSHALRQERWVESAAFTDRPTGLPNRAAFEQRILDMIAADDDDRSFALVYLDIANYRDMSSVQDARTLQQTVSFIAGEVAACLDQGVFLARYSANAFMVVIEDHNQNEHQFMFKRLRKLEGLRTQAGTPVLWRAGQSVYPDTGHSSRRLIRAAMVSRPLKDVGDFENLSDDPSLVRTGS